MFYAYIDATPVGRLLIAGNEDGLKHVAFCQTHFSTQEVQPEPSWVLNERKLKEPIQQLKAYFAGKRKAFDIPLACPGTDFQKRVWKALCEVPFGKTATYGEIAKSVGNPGASRAVGLANGQNPIAIVVPCHRIIGSNGKLTGYGGGLSHKQTLLHLEGVSLTARSGTLS